MTILIIIAEQTNHETKNTETKFRNKSKSEKTMQETHWKRRNIKQLIFAKHFWEINSCKENLNARSTKKKSTSQQTPTPEESSNADKNPSNEIDAGADPGKAKAIPKRIKTNDSKARGGRNSCLWFLERPELWSLQNVKDDWSTSWPTTWWRNSMSKTEQCTEDLSANNLDGCMTPVHRVDQRSTALLKELFAEWKKVLQLNLVQSVVFWKNGGEAQWNVIVTLEISSIKHPNAKSAYHRRYGDRRHLHGFCWEDLENYTSISNLKA